MEQWYKDGEIYNSMTSIRNKMKDTSLPMLLTDSIVAELGFIKVVQVEKPTVTMVQTITEGAVELIDGVPTKGWIITDMFEDLYEDILDVDGVTLVPTLTLTKLAQEEAYIASETAKAQAQMVASMVQHFTDVTTNYIEDKVQAYNVANGLAFKDIDAFTKYAVNTASVHHTIANQFITYADNVWTAVRTYQATATAVPTEAEFKAVLDGVVF